MNLLKFLFALSLSIFLISLQSCGNSCESITCLNDALCANGKCECPPGYTGTYCQFCPPGYSGTGCATYDSCYNVICQNGGTCVSGTCDCPPGYTGTNCQFIQTPVSVSIDKIELTAYPTATTSGTSWDGGSPGSPDVFLSLNSGTTPNLFAFVSNDTFPDANGSMLTYTSGFPYTLAALSSFYSLAVWDNDGPNLNESMGDVYFEPGSYKLTLPSTIDLTTSKIAAKLYVTWNF